MTVPTSIRECQVDNTSKLPQLEVKLEYSFVVL